MQTKRIEMTETEKGVFVMCDRDSGAEFGRAASFDNALLVIGEWLTLLQFEGTVDVTFHPLGAVAFMRLQIRDLRYGAAKNLWSFP